MAQLFRSDATSAVSEAPEADLGRYLAVIRRRRFLIASLTLVVVGASIVYSLLQTPVYEAEAQVLLQPRSSGAVFDTSSGSSTDPVRMMQTEIQILQSQPVRAAVVATLGAAPAVSGSAVGQTDVLAVRAQNTRPARAAAVANAYASAYIKFRRQQAVDGLLAAGQEIQKKIDDIEHQISALDLKVLAAPPDQRAALAQSLAPERQDLVSQQSLFHQKLDQLQVDSALKDGGAQVVVSAHVPATPVSPRPVRNAAMALVFGLSFALAIAFLVEHLDNSIEDETDLQHASRGHPILARIPRLDRRRSRRVGVVSLSDPTSPAAESYFGLRTAVEFLNLGSPVRSVQITSSDSAEGKTSTAVNLAVALARAGKRVVLVCCDLRRPRLHEFFGLDNSTGLTSVLLGQTALPAAIQRVPEQPGLSILASGPLPPNPSELLGSNRMAEVLQALESDSDVVLLDTPPVLPVTDATVVSSRVDATIVVVAVGETDRRALSRAMDLLQQVGAPLVGMVFNGVKSVDPYRASYSYNSYRDSRRSRRGPGLRGRWQRRPAVP